MRRRARTAALTAAALATAFAVAALSTPAGVLAGSAPRALSVTAKTLTATGFGDAAPKAGDHLEFYEQPTGGETGKDYFECVVTNAAGAALCTAQFVLRHGQISIQGMFDINAKTNHVTGSIIGGTGRYDGARGTFLSTGPASNARFFFHFAS